MLRVLAAAIALAALAAGPATAATDLSGAAIPNTSTLSETAQLDGSPSLLKLLATPSSPDDDDPAALAALGAPNGPEEDLAVALDRMAGASSAGEAAGARRFALDVLEGAPVDRAYSGIPLLNWNAPAKVRDVAPGGTVTVRQVRFGDHLIGDTWLLRFADPSQPFRIAYEVTELGGAFGGELAPTPLLADGATPVGGMNAVVAPLALPELETGTLASSRFHPDGAGEHSRLGVQRFVVRMPPPRNVAAILDPSRAAGLQGRTTTGEIATATRALATLAPATAERLAAAAERAGFSGADPTPAERRAAIERLADAAPERRVWRALDALDDEAPGFLAAARAAAASVRPLVGEMRDRATLPAGIEPHAGADVTVVLANNETYVSRRVARVAPGAQLRVAVVNRDGFARAVEARELRDRRPVFGPVDWGEFDWAPLGGATSLAAGETKLLTLAPATGAFAVWLGDTAGGDQAAAAIELDRGPRAQAFRFGPDFASPRHVAEDPQGRMWVTLEGIDTIARLTPSGELSQSAVERYPLPGGAHTLDSPRNPLAPADVFVDGHGIVWATLFLGNAIVRIDPELARDGTGEGMTIHRLDPCPTSDPEAVCREEFPPSPGGPSRGPLQLDGMLDADGNTVLALTEMNVDAIGVMRFSPSGAELNRADVPCDCVAPLGVALGRDGSIWFSEGDTNALGRLRLDQARPYVASTARIEHHPLPFGTTIEDPEHPEPIFSALPHSVAIDPLGRVWLTGEAVAKVAYLDPRAARPGTSDGIVSFDTGHTEFGGLTAPADLAIDRAGTVHWSDEYGDVIGRLDDRGTRPPLRPLARRSLTDSPVVDSRGDLWFMELGANLLTRVEGVTEGAPRPARQPLAVARTSDDVLSGERFAEATAVDVEVERGGAVVARADGVPVAGGAFEVAAGRWTGPQAANPLAAGDRVRVAPRGAYPREPLAFELAHLTAAVNSTGALTGRALSGGRPLGGHVDAAVGDRDLRAGLDPADGRFAAAAQPPLPADAPGTLAWAGAAAGLVGRTVTRFPDVPEPQQPGDPLPPLPAGDDVDVPAATGPGAPGPVASEPQPPAAAAPACPRHWIVGRGRRARVELLGMRAADLAGCLGAPDAAASRRGARRLSYHGKVSLSVRRGRVAGFELTPPGLRSQDRDVGLGSRLRQLAALLRGVPLRGRGDVRSATVRTTGGAVAVLRVELSLRRPRRIVRISVAPARAPQAPQSGGSR